MEFRLTFLAACSILRGFVCDVVEGPSDATVLYGKNHELNCEIDQTDIPGWDEINEDESSVEIFALYQRGSLDDKYSNFNISGTFPVYNLKVTSIEIEDQGIYECVATRVNAKRATLSVEAPVIALTISCDPVQNCPLPDGEVTSEVTCTCTALGAYPYTLELEWTGIEAPVTKPSVTPTSTGRPNSFDFTQEATGSISSTSGSITCTLTNYTRQEARRTAAYEYSSPTCVLKVENEDACTSGFATLFCNCTDASPNEILYSFFRGDFSVMPGDPQRNRIENLPFTAGKETTFYCRGCNGFNFGEGSLGTTTVCEKAETTIPVATDSSDPSPNTNKDCTQRSVPVLVAVCCVEAVVIIAMIVLFVFVHKIKKGFGKGEEQSLETSLHYDTDKENEVCMDLEETKQLSVNHVDLDVSLANLSLHDVLPGKGLIDYRKAQMISTSKREEVVVKTVSDDAPVKLAKLQADEVRTLATLSSNVNVTQFLGRCINVPHLLCYEFVKGTKLREYLRENFQPSKIHQYGNTKQKRYYIPEKGSVETLPKLALQIARGMKYLTAQKFLHPGIRSEKIIFDVTGKCKLYDFVSKDNAKEIMAILWGKSVPYQWMPPEYLFLEKLGPSVDIWSFGVLIWEIFSYGALPHKGKGRTDVEKELRKKENLPLPNNCPGAIWQITLNCWDQSPEKRPSFDHLALQLSHMCNDDKEYDEIKSK